MDTYEFAQWLDAIVEKVDEEMASTDPAVVFAAVARLAEEGNLSDLVLTKAERGAERMAFKRMAENRDC